MSSQALEFEVAPIRKPNGSEALAVTTPNPFALFQQALAQGMTLEQMQVFQAMCERWEANEARKAFVVSMNRFKANPPQIEKNKHVEFGQGERRTSYDHATLDHVCKVITQTLGQFGITHRWEIDDSSDLIKVTCILRHEQGHSEETSMRGPADTSGSKNAIQARASTITYLERYTLLAATGLAAGGMDNDGADGPAMEDLQERLEWIANCRTLDELKKVFFEALRAAKASGDKRAITDLEIAKNKRKAELE